MAYARILERELVAAGLSVSSEIQEGLSLYLGELERWSRSMNLTSLRGDEAVRRLVVEPVWIGQQLRMSGRLADVGSGNGSPGIPLLLSRRLDRLHLIEARTRRAAFLRHIAAQLDGERIVVHRSRVEAVEKMEAVDWVTLQAVRPSALVREALSRLFPSTTHVVWITAGKGSPAREATRISVPQSESEAWVFRLDQF